MIGRSRWRRHPPALVLMAWHDGERDDEAVTVHVQECARCWEGAAGLAAVDSAIRQAAHRRLASPSVAAGEQTAPMVASAASLAPAPASTTRGAAWLRVGVVAVAAMTAVALAPAVSVSADLSRTVLTGMLESAESDRPPDADGPGSARPASSGSVEDVAPPADASRPSRIPVSPAAEDGVGRPASSRPALAVPLRLGVPLPGGERSRAEDAEDIVRAVRAAVAAANERGGIGGRDVSVEVVDADDLDEGSYDVLVGGLAGADTRHAGRAWILPADPDARGTAVVSVDPLPAEASRLVAGVLDLPATAVVGVLDDGGSQRDLGASFRSRRVVTVDPEDRCHRAIRAVRAERAAVVVFALEADVLDGCLDALRLSTWTPPRGIVLPAYTAFDLPSTSIRSAAYAPLALPWPAWDEPATARFRAAADGSTSYRALVSFAAAELAIAVARDNGGHLDRSMVTRGAWRTDLWAFNGGNNVGGRVGERVLFGWSAADRAADADD